MLLRLGLMVCDFFFLSFMLQVSRCIDDIRLTRESFVTQELRFMGPMAIFSISFCMTMSISEPMRMVDQSRIDVAFRWR